jgi:predicted O-linked N-acetylglucosamine transferase (SPINDLY family)
MASNPEQIFRNAIALHKSGRLAEAETLYRSVLVHDPVHADSLHLLGVASLQAGRHEVAVGLIRRALRIKPDRAHYHASLGNALKGLGKAGEAVAAYRRSISLQPDHAPTHGNLGNALAMAGRTDEAIAAYRKAVALDPAFAEAWFNLGNVLELRDEFTEAISNYRQAIRLRPAFFQAHGSLGAVLAKTGDYDGAKAALERAIELEPRHAISHCNLGHVLIQRGDPRGAVAACERAVRLQPDHYLAFLNLGIALSKTGCQKDSIAALRKAVELQPGNPQAHVNLGAVLKDAGLLDEAVAACEIAIRIAPELPEAHFNLGNCLQRKGRLDDAVSAYRRAITLRPRFAEALANLGNALRHQGLLDEAESAYRQSHQLKPDSAEIHSNLAYLLHYRAGADPHEVAAEHLRWNKMHARPLAPFVFPHGNPPNPERKLRVGYLSADFREHSVASFFIPLVEKHDRDFIEVHCYSNVRVPDAVTKRIRGLADGWRDIADLNDTEVAKLVRDDRIDILVDLSGHTDGNRLLVFARKPAPVQVTGLGYPGTTGLDFIDYRLTDAASDPVGTTERFHSERLVRLPGGAWCYQPGETPDVSIHRDGGIVFGCFNNFSKVTGPMLGIWCQILHATPGSILLLKSFALSDDSTNRRIREFFRCAGIDPDRIELLGHLPERKSHLSLYSRVDVALDTFPYHGTTTTCEALWMGTPVITMEGSVHASRVGVSLLSQIGFAEWIARCPVEYLQKAVALASDRSRLEGIRAALRERMKASPLMGSARFTREVEDAYRDMWTKWCSSLE